MLCHASASGGQRSKCTLSNLAYCDRSGAAEPLNAALVNRILPQSVQHDPACIMMLFIDVHV
eukprot:458901-Rhodomonas_salina.3